MQIYSQHLRCFCSPTVTEISQVIQLLPLEPRSDYHKTLLDLMRAGF